MKVKSITIEAVTDDGKTFDDDARTIGRKFANNDTLSLHWMDFDLNGDKFKIIDLFRSDSFRGPVIEFRLERCFVGEQDEEGST